MPRKVEYAPIPLRDGPRFSLGRILSTPAAMKLMTDYGVNPGLLLDRHVGGDWGDLGREDSTANERALDPQDPRRVLSAYELGDYGLKVLVVTEWDRSQTVFLTPDEY